MILPRHYQETQDPHQIRAGGADCCRASCHLSRGPRASFWLCLGCGSTARICGAAIHPRGAGKRCILPLGHEALQDFRNHENEDGEQTPVIWVPA